jgi:hypothetical protein
MAELERLLTEVKRNFGPVRVWLTEYGYQTNPPDALLGVPPATQAQYVAQSARRVYLAPQVDMLIQYLVYDDSLPEGWQSGLFTASGEPKPSYTAFRFPLVQASRAGDDAVLWGQIRPRAGPQPYRLGTVRNGRVSWLGGTRWTDTRGYLTASVRLRPGTVVVVYSPRDDSYSLPLRLT